MPGPHGKPGMAPEKAKDFKGTLRKLLAYLGKYRIAVLAVLLFAVSLAQERGGDLRGWVLSRPLPLRWVILIGSVVAVLLLGVWGSGFDEATFIYYQL